MSDLVLGVDGGGTKTILALADRAGHVVLHERAAGIGPIESPHWPETLQALVTQTAPYADRIVHGSFGMPSFGEITRVSDEQTDVVRRLTRFPHTILNDVHTAFEGAFVGRPGVLLLAGTGSMVWAADAAGAHLRVGGWGHGIGDEGSAFWIGQEAIATLSRCLDGRWDDSGFAESIAAFLDLPGQGRDEALMGWYYGASDVRVQVAALSRVVDDLANAGNATAQALLSQAATHLAAHVRAAWTRLPTLPGGVWSGVGSVMRSARVARSLSEFLETPPVLPELPPIGGALWRAGINAGWPIDTAWVARLRTGLAAYSPNPEH